MSSNVFKKKCIFGLKQYSNLSYTKIIFLIIYIYILMSTLYTLSHIMLILAVFYSVNINSIYIKVK